MTGQPEWPWMAPGPVIPQPPTLPPPPADAVNAARHAYAAVMDTWNGRTATLAAKTDEAWKAAITAALLRARGAQ